MRRVDRLMKAKNRASFLMLGLVGLAAAACNPTVDPAATFSAEGEVVGVNGQALANAEVRLIKYSSDLGIFAPSAETLFAENPNGDSDIGLNVSVVKTTQTDMNGTFEMSFTGSDIAKPGGITTSDGRVEVSTVVLVVRDPSDPDKRSGVYTYQKLFMDSDKVWGAGKLDLWNAEGTADTAAASTSGLVKLSWKKLMNVRTTGVRNAYRVTISGTNTATL